MLIKQMHGKDGQARRLALGRWRNSTGFHPWRQPGHFQRKIAAPRIFPDWQAVFLCWGWKRHQGRIEVLVAESRWPGGDGANWHTCADDPAPAHRQQGMVGAVLVGQLEGCLLFIIIQGLVHQGLAEHPEVCWRNRKLMDSFSAIGKPELLGLSSGSSAGRQGDVVEHGFVLQLFL